MPAFWRVYWCRWPGSLCYFADVSKIGQYTAGCSAFCPLSCFAFGALSLNVALFRVFRAFLGGFGRFVWVYVVLRALRGLWGFCTRVELGGFTACCVFPSIYPFICLSFYLFTCFLSFALSALFWLSFVALCGCVVGAAFSLSDKTKKDRICFALFLYLVLVSLF